MFLPVTLWQAWEITKRRDIHEHEDEEEDNDNYKLETGEIGRRVTYTEKSQCCNKEMENCKEVEPIPLILENENDMNIGESQDEKISLILERISKLEEEVI